jgi:hypothetical protein
VRHRIEQLVPLASRPVDAHDDHVTRPSAAAGVTYNRGVSNSYAKNLSKQLEQELAGAFVEITPDQNLLSRLYDADQRPAIAVVLSHVTRKPLSESESLVPRMALVPVQEWTGPKPIPPLKWLHDSLVHSYTRRGPKWEEQPHTVVLLMGCSSGATEVSTLNSLVHELTLAGAGAIVGTEVTVSSSLAARFAHEVTRDLWGGKRCLGQAIRDFNRQLIYAGNPLIFTFTCLGNADLTIEP